MKIPFSVFTARHGYEWSNIPTGMTEAQLTGYREIISSTRPEYMKDGERFDGVLYDGNVIVVFTALRVPEWDLVKRTAHYYAVAFIPRKDCHLVNIDHLLNDDLFGKPTREPPSEIEYTGDPSASTPPEVIDSIRSGKTDPLDFSFCGDLLSNNGHLGVKWQLFRTNVPNWNGKPFVFEPNQLVFSAAKKSISSFANAFPQRTEPVRSPEEESPSPVPRTISLDRSDDPTYQLEYRFSKKIEKIKKERDNDILIVQDLVRTVAKLEIAVVALCVVSVCLLIVAIIGRDRVISMISPAEPAAKVESSKDKSEKATTPPNGDLTPNAVDGQSRPAEKNPETKEPVATSTKKSPKPNPQSRRQGMNPDAKGNAK